MSTGRRDGEGDWVAMPDAARRTRKDEQSEATRAALLAAARQLFTEHGFTGTGTEQIVRTAGVTRGALYHHYRDKEALFRAVFEQIETELVARVMKDAMKENEPFARMQRGFDSFLDACLEPHVQRIVLLEGPTVLGWDAWHEIDEAYMFGITRGGIDEAIAAGAIEPQPSDALAHLLLAAASTAGLVVARDADPRRARATMGASLQRLLEGLRVKPDPPRRPKAAPRR